MNAKKTTRLALVGMLAGALSLGGSALAQSTSGATSGSTSGSSAGSMGGSMQSPSTGSGINPGSTQSGTTQDSTLGTGAGGVQNDQSIVRPPTDLGGTGGSGNLPRQDDVVDPSRGTSPSTGTQDSTGGTGGSGLQDDTTLSPGTSQPGALTPDSNWSQGNGTGGSSTPGQGTLQPDTGSGAVVNPDQGGINQGSTSAPTR